MWWALSFLIPIYLVGRYQGYNKGLEVGVENAIVYFKKNGFFKPEKEKELENE
jgi:hypothetical protein